MNVEFPHLNDTAFPGVDNDSNLSGVDVYKYQNDFDYYRWRNQVSVKLLNVLWNSDYADVPYFDNDVKRDEWFDNHEGIIKPLETPFNNTPETFVQLAIPYNDAYKYNYLVVDMPIQTSTDEPLDYEAADTRVKRWYYFIEDIVQLSPSTTRFKLNIDYWTTFIHSVAINYLMLERGHAPMTKTTVEQYLANPLENSEYLLADDFNYQRGDTFVKASNYTPIGNGKKYVIFAAPYRPQDFELFGGTDYSGDSTPPTYDNIPNERSGFQMEVNGYQWRYGETDYSNAHLPIYGLLDQDAEIYNGTICYAIDALHANSFFNRMAHTRVHFIHGIQAIFILAENMFEREEGFQFEGETIYRCHRKVNELNYVFDKAAFNFDEKYADLAKLYTSPYSFVEVTDDNGRTFNFNIENTGRLKMRSEISLAFPYLRYNVLFAGINGNGSFGYTWKNLNDVDVNKTMWESDFSKFMMNWDIPTYSIYISAENEYAANNAAGMAARRLSAIKDYKNATRFANTNKENTADTMQTNTDNVAASGETMFNNVARTQRGLINNMTRENDTNTFIVDTLQNAGDVRTGLDPVGYLSKTTWANFNKVSKDADVDRIMLSQNLSIENDYISSMALANQGSQLLSGATGALMSGSTAPIASGLVSAISVSVTTPITLSNNQNIVDIQDDAITRKIGNAKESMQALFDAQKDYTGDLKDANNALRKANTEQFSDTLANNGINDRNADYTRQTNNANAVRTQNTETDNADYTRLANVRANKANLEQAQIDAEAQYKNARLQRPVNQGQYSDDAFPDIWMRRGIRFNIRTQTKAAIAQAGDAFLRFGYALHRAWDMTQGFNYMKHFTYWKAEDIWVNDGNGVANIATNTISDILLKGVTVWKNPSEIGTVSIYDNI